MNRVDVERVSDRARQDIKECGTCFRTGDEYVLCGWHENLVVAFRIVEVTAGTIIEAETDE